jgi:hypothetical protein
VSDLFPARVRGKSYGRASELAAEIRRRALGDILGHPSHAYPADWFRDLDSPKAEAAIQAALELLVDSKDVEVVRIVLHLGQTDPIYEALLARFEGSQTPALPDGIRVDVADGLARWVFDNLDQRTRALASFDSTELPAHALRLVLARGSAKERVSRLALAAASGEMTEMLARLAGFTLASENGDGPLIAAAASMFGQPDDVRRGLLTGAAEFDSGWQTRPELTGVLGLTDQ